MLKLHSSSNVLVFWSLYYILASKENRKYYDTSLRFMKKQRQPQKGFLRACNVLQNN